MAARKVKAAPIVALQVELVQPGRRTGNLIVLVSRPASVAGDCAARGQKKQGEHGQQQEVSEVQHDDRESLVIKDLGESRSGIDQARDEAAEEEQPARRLPVQPPIVTRKGKSQIRY